MKGLDITIKDLNLNQEQVIKLGQLLSDIREQGDTELINILEKGVNKATNKKEVVNGDLIELLSILKTWNGGEISELIMDEFTAFSFTNDWDIETIGDLVEAMKVEMSYFDN